MAEVYVEPFTGSFAATYRAESKLPFIVWGNFANRTNITSSGSTAGTDVINLVEENTVDLWRSSTAGNSWIRISGISTLTFNTVAIRGHNFSTIGATLTVKHGSATVATYKPTTDGVVIITFPDVVGQSTATLEIASSGVAIVGSILFGRKLVFQNGLDGSGFRPIEFSTVTDLLSNRSQTGQLLSNKIIRRGISAELPINPVDDAFVQGRFKSFVRHYNDGRPFVFASSPSLAPRDAGWFWRPPSASDLDITSVGNGLYSEFSISAEGVYS